MLRERRASFFPFGYACYSLLLGHLAMITDTVSGAMKAKTKKASGGLVVRRNRWFRKLKGWYYYYYYYFQLPHNNKDHY